MGFRKLALTVEQQAPGEHWWVLMETTGDDIWSQLGVAQWPESSWVRAYEAGAYAMGTLVGATTIHLRHGFGVDAVGRDKAPRTGGL